MMVFEIYLLKYIFHVYILSDNKKRRKKYFIASKKLSTLNFKQKNSYKTLVLKHYYKETIIY